MCTTCLHAPHTCMHHTPACPIYLHVCTIHLRAPYTYVSHTPVCVPHTCVPHTSVCPIHLRALYTCAPHTPACTIHLHVFSISFPGIPDIRVRQMTSLPCLIPCLIHLPSSSSRLSSLIYPAHPEQHLAHTSHFGKSHKLVTTEEAS